MPPTTPLFEAGDLKTPLGRTATEEEAVYAERIVWGWLKGPLGLTERPEPVPDEVWAWAVELGAIHLENPTGLKSEELGPAKKAYSSERAGAILAECSGWGSGTAPLAPQGCFPPPPRYPDPARGW